MYFGCDNYIPEMTRNAEVDFLFGMKRYQMSEWIKTRERQWARRIDKQIGKTANQVTDRG